MSNLKPERKWKMTSYDQLANFDEACLQDSSSDWDGLGSRLLKKEILICNCFTPQKQAPIHPEILGTDRTWAAAIEHPTSHGNHW